MGIPISVLFSNSNPCFLTFNQCCTKNLKSPYSPGFVGKKEHLIFPSCFITTQHFRAPEMRSQVTAGHISTRIILQVAVLHRILPPISPASHCFHKWHLSASRPGLGSSAPVHPMFLQGTSSTSLYPGLKMQIYWLDDKRNLNKLDIAVTPCPSLPAMVRKLCFTQSTRERKMEAPQENSRGFFPCEQT